MKCQCRFEEDNGDYKKGDFMPFCLGLCEPAINQQKKFKEYENNMDMMDEFIKKLDRIEIKFKDQLRQSLIDHRKSYKMGFLDGINSKSYEDDCE
jgi:hypothetical protein